MNSIGQKTARRLLPSALMVAFALSPAWGKGLQWHVEQYGRADINREDVKRAHSVFAAVRAAADRSARRYPQFVVLKRGSEPIAAALKDGGVVVNLRTLELCFKPKSKQRGDDRLAFVLAHELAHLVIESFAQFASGDSPAIEKVADERGLLTMTMAGFRPESLLEGSKTLFHEWLEESPGSPDNAASRAEAFKSRLQAFSKAVPIFQAAVDFYHLGYYPQAILLFRVFLQQFPSREVFHNLALSHMQQALGILAMCDGASLVRFSLPLQADPWTLAQRSTFRGTPQHCLENPAFVNSARSAANYLQEAISKDPSYLLARIHLATLKVLQEDSGAALIEAYQASRLAPADPYVVNIQAVSEFLAAEKRSFPDRKKKARESLKALLQQQPDFLPALFNLARIESLSGNWREAQQHWDAYLEQSPPDGMAQAVAEILGREPPSAIQLPAPKRPPCIPLGIPSESVLTQLSGMELIYKKESIEVRRSDEMRVLRIERAIKVVELFTDLPASPPAVKSLPAIQGAYPSYSLLLESEGMALKVVGGQVRSRLFFQPLKEQ